MYLFDLFLNESSMKIFIDIFKKVTSETGNLHGQPVSFLLYVLDKYLPKLKAFDWMKPW